MISWSSRGVTISKCPPPVCPKPTFLDKTRSLTLPRQQRNRESALGGEGCVVIHRCRLQLCSTCCSKRPLSSFTAGDTAPPHPDHSCVSTWLKLKWHGFISMRSVELERMVLQSLFVGSSSVSLHAESVPLLFLCWPSHLCRWPSRLCC